MASQTMTQSYSREEARRLLRLSERQLRSWERQKLVAVATTYGFGELLALRTLIQLRRKGVATAQVRRALHALAEKLDGVEFPLTKLQLYADGHRIRVEIDGRHMEAESGQLLLNFGPGEISRLLEFKAPENPQADAGRRGEAELWFQRGLELDQTGAPLPQILEAYQKALDLDPQSAGALVNLGTLYFNARSFTQAESCYRKALEVDPEYALAHFDLANLYDERGQRGPALEHYRSALRVSPNYADAHYNIALLYQGANQPLQAVHHWMAYLKLDPSSQWSTVARRELAKLRKAAVVPGARGQEDAG